MTLSRDELGSSNLAENYCGLKALESMYLRKNFPATGELELTVISHFYISVALRHQPCQGPIVLGPTPSL